MNDYAAMHCNAELLCYAMNSVPYLVFRTIQYVTHSFFIHLGIANVNCVLNISNKYLFGYFVFFQMCIFVNVKTLLTN